MVAILDRSRLVSATCAVLGLGFCAPARAHESAAELPLFARGECIERVDLREVAALEIAYQVAYDDTELIAGDIPVADAKTHQFFAFQGSLVANGFEWDFHPFDADQPVVLLPLWLTVDDVKRAAQASGSLDATGFSASDVPAGAVLDAVPELAGRYLRITADDARVPITQAQAAKGVSWDLGGVQPGLYTIAGYVFSPPFNGWSARTTRVKLVDAEHDAPALHVEPLRASLFATQGLRVLGCLDVPEGTELRADFTVEERPEIGRVPWLDPRAVDSGELELCFHNPRPELTGSLRLRFELIAPDGARWLFHAPDPITALPGGAACVEAGHVCCDFPSAQPPGGEPTAGAAGPTMADAPDAGMRGEPAREPDADAASSASSGSGCTTLRTYVAASARLVWLGWLLALACLRARRPTRTARRSRAPRPRPSP